MKKVSIIIPVYNVEKYIIECLNSILNQTYTNFEAILVDDQSTDHSGLICDEYALKDNRFKVIHKKNGGAASARNVAFEHMTGDYVCFIDSDDYVNENYLEKLVHNLEGYQADVAVCSFFDLYKNKKIKHDYELELLECSKFEFLNRFLSDWTCGILWNKIFKKHLIEGIRFIEGRRIDDEFFTYKCIMKSNKVVLFNDALLYYRQRKSSVMQSEKNMELILRDRMDYMVTRYKNVTNAYPELRNDYFSNLLDTFIHIKREITTKELNKKYNKYLYFIFKEFFHKNNSIKEIIIFIYNIIFVKNVKKENQQIHDCFD